MQLAVKFRKKMMMIEKVKFRADGLNRKTIPEKSQVLSASSWLGVVCQDWLVLSGGARGKCTSGNFV